MADPTGYTRTYDFAGFQATAPADPLPADQVDNEYDNIAEAIGSTQTALADIRRSDGALVNSIVTVDSVAAATWAAMGVAVTPNDDVVTVAESITDVETVADNIADVTNFAAVYIGKAVTNPSTRTDGSALQLGDLHFNTTADSLRVYTAGGWTDTVQAAGLDTYTYTATAAQTEFTGADDNGATLTFAALQILVTQNGLVLRPDEYTEAADGTGITLDAGASDSDKIVITVFSAVAAADVGFITTSAIEGDGSTVTFVLPTTAVSSRNVRVYLEGVKQAHSTYTVSGGYVTLTEAPADGSTGEIEVFTTAPLGTATADVVTLEDGETLQSFVNRNGGFASFSDFQAASALPWSAGAVVWAAGVPYVREVGSTSVSGLPDWSLVTLDGGTF